MDILGTINGSIELLKKLNEISKNIKQAELKSLIADLSNQLADAKIAAAEIKEEIAALREEIAALKAHRDREKKPDVKWGCYYFDGDQTRLYCPTCYDTKGQKILTSRANTKYRMCNACKGVIGS